MFWSGLREFEKTQNKKGRSEVEPSVANDHTLRLKSELGYLKIENLQALINSNWRLKKTSTPFYVYVSFPHENKTWIYLYRVPMLPGHMALFHWHSLLLWQRYFYLLLCDHLRVKGWSCVPLLRLSGICKHGMR